jgi:RNA polymerase sigma factor for flagellar operon FliA
MTTSPPLSFSRTLDPLARDARTSSRKLTLAITQLTRTLARQPDEHEIASALQLTSAEYRRTLTRIADLDTPALDLLALEESDLNHAIAQVPAAVQNLLALYYGEDCSAEEVGAVLGMTPARAQELHAEAMHRLQAMIALRRH